MMIELFAFSVFVSCYLGLNVVIGIGVSLSWLWKCIWIEQNSIGKICATIFYLPACIFALLKYAVVFILFWVFYGLAYVFQMLVNKVLAKLFKKIKKFEL